MSTQSVKISPADLQQMMADHPDVRVVDVRSGAEFESVHIKGAYNLPLTDLPSIASQVSALGQPMVLVCQSGVRAAQAEQVLAKNGCVNIKILDGGVNAWEKAGYHVEKGRQVWALDRQVRFVAGTIVLAMIILSIWVPWTKWIAGGVGFGLFFSAVTNTCAMGALLMKLPYNKGNSCDVQTVMEQLTSSVKA